MRSTAVAVLLGLGLPVGLVLAGCSDGPATTGPDAPPARSPGPSGSPSSAAPSPTTPPPAKPLAGRVVVLDPGHQLGNGRFPAEIGRLVEAGGSRKPCNTTGTSTDGGYPESTLTFDVSQRVARGLEALGARVVLTRDTDSADEWGPCVDVRGRAGGSSADLKLSVHADGNLGPRATGFHVITPPDRAPWTDDIARPSRRLALVVRRELREAGLDVATYVGDRGLDVRSDLATLNLSDVPTVMVELGNMRAPVDARLMTSARGRQRYADALVAAVRSYLG